MPGILELVHVYTGFALGAKWEALKRAGNNTWGAGHGGLQEGQYAGQSGTLKLRQALTKASGHHFNVLNVPGQPPEFLFTTYHWSRSSLQLSLWGWL